MCQKKCIKECAANTSLQSLICVDQLIQFTWCNTKQLVCKCMTNSFLWWWYARGRLYLQEGLMILDGIPFLNLMAMTKRISNPYFMPCYVQVFHSYMQKLIHCIYSCCSYAEMPKEEKNKISHRYKSLALVKSHFSEAGYTFQIKDIWKLWCLLSMV